MFLLNATIYILISILVLAYLFLLLLFKKTRNIKLKSVLIIFGSGGHTTEMIRLIEELKVEHKYNPIYFITAHVILSSITIFNNNSFDKTYLFPNYIV